APLDAAIAPESGRIGIMIILAVLFLGGIGAGVAFGLVKGGADAPVPVIADPPEAAKPVVAAPAAPIEAEEKERVAALLQKGQKLYDDRDLAGAVAAYEEAASRDPQSP